MWLELIRLAILHKPFHASIMVVGISPIETVLGSVDKLKC